MAANNTTLKAVLGVILTLVLLVAAWSMWNSRAVASNGVNIATNTANISNVQEDIKEIKDTQKEILREVRAR